MAMIEKFQCVRLIEPVTDHGPQFITAAFVERGEYELILVMQLGTVPNDVVMRSIRTFGEEVLPAFG